MLPDGYAIRPGGRVDARAFQEIERAAAQAFVGRAEIGVSDIDFDEVTPLERLEAMAGEGLLWAGLHRETPVAYLGAEWTGKDLYIAEVDVHPDHEGKQLGAALIETAVAHGFANSAARITLSTFTEIPWNRPYYERLGFRVLPEREWNAFMRNSMARQEQGGLDISKRCIMVRGWSA